MGKKSRFGRKAAKLTESLASYMQKVHDFRDRRGRRHELWVCLLLILIGNLCGQTSMCAIERYMKVRERELRGFLPLYGKPGEGIPSHNTLSRIMEQLHFEQLHHVFLEWVEALTSDIAGLGGQLHADGKGVRAARPGDDESKVPYVLNALMQASGIKLYVALRKVGLKTNEIAVLPDLLSLADLTNMTVTVDAIGTQVKVVGLIKEAGGHYILPVKANQSAFREDIESHYRMMVHSGDFTRVGPFSDPKVRHGRIEVRSACLVSAEGLVTDRDGFRNICFIALISRERKVIRRKKAVSSSVQEVFYVSDFCGDASEFARLVRDHWICESAHWWLDKHLDEDRSTAHKGFAVENLALMRRIIYNVVQLTCRKEGIEPAAFNAHFHSFANVRKVLFKPLLIA